MARSSTVASALDRRTSATRAGRLPPWVSCWAKSCGDIPYRAACPMTCSVSSASETPSCSASATASSTSWVFTAVSELRLDLRLEVLAGAALGGQIGVQVEAGALQLVADVVLAPLDLALHHRLRQRHLGRGQQRLEHLVPGLRALLQRPHPGQPLADVRTQVRQRVELARGLRELVVQLGQLLLLHRPDA